MRDRPLPTTTLRPDPGVAALWSAWGGLLVAAGVWFVWDASWSAVSWVSLAVFVLVTGWFVAQLVAPGVVRVRLTEDELQARAFGWERRVAWDDVHLARVRNVFGDPILELHVREVRWTRDPSDTRAVVVPLPVGADLDRLHAFLAARLGTGELRPSGRLQPLDPQDV